MTKPSRLSIFTLVAAFLWVTLSTAFGCVWCEHGSFVDTHVANHVVTANNLSNTDESLDIHKSVNTNSNSIN